METTFFMRLLTLLCIGLFGLTHSHCGDSGKTSVPRCDTTCLKDTIQFVADHPTTPKVAIVPTECRADTLLWSYEGLGVLRKISLKFVLKKDIPLQASNARCIFDGNKKAFLLFNDCGTGRGYQIKLPFDKRESISIRNKSINSIDPKFSINPNLIAYTDQGNIFVEHTQKGTIAMMTFGEELPIDHDHIHEYIDSVNITSERIWVRVKIQNKWKELEKSIELESIDK